jgi:ABC-type multidrug transport system fused ATPase/permease subunit
MVWRLLFELLKPHRWLVAVILAAALLQTAMSLAAPWPLKIILDDVVGNHALPRWMATGLLPLVGGGGKLHIALLAAIIAIVVAIVSGLAFYVNTYFTNTLGQWIANDLRIRTYHHLQRLSLSYYNTHQVGTILSTMSDDIGTIQNFASGSIPSLFIDLLTVTGMIGVMFALRWDFALVAIAAVPFMFFFVHRIRRAIQTTTKELRKRQADIVDTLQQGLQSVEVVQAFEEEDLLEAQLKQVSRKALQAAMRARRVQALLLPVVSLAVTLCTAFVLFRGSVLILAGTMTVGTLTVFLSYLGQFFAPVRDIAAITSTLAQAAVAAERVRGILDADTIIPERPDAKDPQPFHGDIVFENVAFSYDSDTPVLRDVSFTIKPGQLVGIVGGTGSGKSTVVSLIPRFYDTNSGNVKIDSADIRGLKLHGLRRQIGFVLQETVLFRGTVRENIAFGRPGATEAEIIQAAKLANADEFITRMSHGYDSMVGDRGLTLSGGQRQRIGIARALIRNDPILILDEPTAALDAESEQLVMQALERLMKGRTVIAIAHRLSTIRDADNIVVLKDGVVAEQGSHEQLLALNGVYAELHRIQYAKETV